MKIHTIDQEFLSAPEVIASYLLEGNEGPVLIETGPASTREVLESKVKDLGFELEEVKHVLVTHIHLDHSGGAGYWARRGSTVYVHSRGARHLIQPDKLIASATRIYQDRMDELWGKTIAIPEDQVVVFQDEARKLAGLEIRAIDTPGHARHHLAFQVEDVVFTGDVAGCCLPGCNFPSVPGPPPEFDRKAWKESLEKLRACQASKLYLTHFGRVEEPARYLDDLEKRLDECVDFVAANSALSMEELQQAYSAWDRERAREWNVSDADYERYEKANPSFMSAQGIRRYLEAS